MTAEPTPVLQEDDPGWDCHTMGNLICGTEPAKHVLPSTGASVELLGSGGLFLLAGIAVLLVHRGVAPR